MVPNRISELAPLRCAVCADPSGFELVAPINSTQAHYLAHDPPNRHDLLEEHRSLRSTLVSAGVDIVDLRCVPGCAYQVFARDIAFVIGDALYLSKMAKPVRQRELGAFVDVCEARAWKLHHLPSGSIEGGDVLLVDKTVFVGVSQRTTRTAIDALRGALPAGYKAVAVALASDILHLDTVLSVLGNHTVVCYPVAFIEGLPSELAGYHVIEVDRREMASLGVNMLPVSCTTVIAQARHGRLNACLLRRGLKVIAVKMDQTTKLGGGPRCCILPICG